MNDLHMRPYNLKNIKIVEMKRLLNTLSTDVGGIKLIGENAL